MSGPSSSIALTKRPASAISLMPPPPAPKRIKRPTTVLDEDTYVSAISHIIRRDFFPGLEETDAQQEYLNALESGNKGWIREAGAKLTSVMTPVPGVGGTARTRGTRFGGAAAGIAAGLGGKTPSVWGADTPRTEIGEENDEKGEDEEGLGKLDSVDLDMSLGAFQAKYTSEDQESFNQILDRQNKSRFEKNAWLRDGNRYASKQRLAQQKVLEARKQDEDEGSRAVVPHRPSQNPDDRPAAPNMHKHSAFNMLMFNPDSIEAWAPTRAQAAQDASLAPPKRVLHANTRLPDPSTRENADRPPSPTISAIQDAIAGHPRLNPSEMSYAGSETPRVNGYAFVDAQPEAPADDEDEDHPPTDLLERFGAYNSSALAGGRSFSISEANRREKLHHKMVERIAISKRSGSSAANAGAARAGPGKSVGTSKSETPRFLSAPTPAQRALLQAARGGGGGGEGGKKAVGNLTPAAQRLLQSVGGKTPTPGLSGGAAGGGGAAGAGAKGLRLFEDAPTAGAGAWKTPKPPRRQGDGKKHKNGTGGGVGIGTERAVARGEVSE